MVPGLALVFPVAGVVVDAGAGVGVCVHASLGCYHPIPRGTEDTDMGACEPPVSTAIFSGLLSYSALSIMNEAPNPLGMAAQTTGGGQRRLCSNPKCPRRGTDRLLVQRVAPLTGLGWADIQESYQ